MPSSAIRDLLKITARPEIISLAGGLPDPELAPRERMAQASAAALAGAVLLGTAIPPGAEQRHASAASDHRCTARTATQHTDIISTAGSET